jgi:hypothetical protein
MSTHERDVQQPVGQLGAGPAFRSTTGECLVFLDTEFTDLDAPELLSLGLVTDSGKEFYAELDLSAPEGLHRSARASAFVRAEVLTQWGRLSGAACSKRELGRRTGEWLQALAPTGPIRIHFDCKADWTLMQKALLATGRGEHLGVRLEAVDVAGLAHSPEGEVARTHRFNELLRRKLHRHHALADAIALRDAFVAARAMRESLARRAAATMESR